MCSHTSDVSPVFIFLLVTVATSPLEKLLRKNSRLITQWGTRFGGNERKGWEKRENTEIMKGRERELVREKGVRGWEKGMGKCFGTTGLCKTNLT